MREPEIPSNSEDISYDEGNGHQRANHKLDFPPAPSIYDRKSAALQCSPETLSTFVAAQLRYIKDEIYEGDLRPLAFARPSLEDCQILELLINCGLE